jgi:hypothetical protein
MLHQLGWCQAGDFLIAQETGHGILLNLWQLFSLRLSPLHHRKRRWLRPVPECRVCQAGEFGR